MPPSAKPVPCPECRFPNVPGSAVCLSCKAALSGGGRASSITQRFVRGHDGPVDRPAPELRQSDGLTELLSRRTVAWLVCAPFDPIPLGAVPMLTIGRDRAADLVLPHPGVSRTHAVVRVLGRTVLLEDRSSVGTLVNGARIEGARELRVGDVVGIGPYELRIAPVGGAADGDGEQTRGARPEPGPSGMAMSGNLELVGPDELLQGLELHRRTGTLRVTTADGRSGALVVEDGRPRSARLGALDGLEAALAIARLRAGRFEVLAQAEPGGGPVTGSLTELLLEAHRRLDEARRDEGAREGGAREGGAREGGAREGGA